MQRRSACARSTVAMLGSTAGAAPPPVDVTPTHVQFGSQPFETQTKKTFTVTNKSSEAVLVSIEQVFVGDDFSPGQIESTCPLTDSSTLQPGETCTHVVGFRPSAFFAGHESALMRVIVRDAAGNTIHTRDVKLSGRGF